MGAAVGFLFGCVLAWLYASSFRGNVNRFVCWHAVGCLGQHCVFLFCGIPWSGCLLWWLVVVGCVLCENCIVDASILFFCSFLFACLPFCVVVRSVLFCVTGVWWMPWHARPMKDV